MEESTPISKVPKAPIKKAATKSDPPKKEVPKKTTSKKSEEPQPLQVVWQWENDGSRWKDFDAMTSTLIESAFQSGETRVDLTHGYFGGVGGYTIDLDEMVQIKNNTGFSRGLRRMEGKGGSSSNLRETDPSTVPRAKPTWQWQDGEGEWKDFDSTSIRILEGTCTQGQRTTILQHGNFSKDRASIDFGELTMTGKTSGDQFPIRRHPELKGSSVYGTKPKVQKEVESEFDDLESKQIKAAKKLLDYKILKKKEIPEEDCPICLCPLQVESSQKDPKVVKLSKCQGHVFHEKCIVHCVRSEFLVCPMCSQVYGTRIGTQPAGRMDVSVESSIQIPGQTGKGCIIITYSFPSGIQGPEHPNPGQQYHGTTRAAYLPNNKEGKKLLKLLQLAWERKLIFRVGTSVTTGAENSVIWNGIHHKTDIDGGAENWAWPDDTYFERVTDELSSKGVTENDISD
eukprot:TRINITY_DN8127_c0_g1_i1.p1 TRINITY_DN8127_c0_g1~~TRINITY_DN8127_c0_g1_i1.p1  ORF type:complete len:490 (-),score=173.21 TRINITY_DN8127_c0_g1_i1:39-1406(-)